MKAPYKLNSRNWSSPDREWLEEQHFILGKPYSQIAKELGCCKKTIYRWVDSTGVSWENLVDDDNHPPFKVGEGQGAVRFYGVTREWLEIEYIKNDKSSNQIAKDIGGTAFGVCNWLKKFDIPLRTDEERAFRHSERMSGEGNPAWVGGTARRYQVRILEEKDPIKVCSWCGTDEDIQIHHIDHNRDNADLSNLVWLCGNCNKLEAQINILQESNRAIVDIGDNEIKVTFSPGAK